MLNVENIKFNYYEYPENEVYISAGINVGFATKLYKISDGKIFHNNLSFANVFANYIRNEFDEKYVVNVERTATCFTCKCKKEVIGSVLQETLAEIFNNQLEKNRFEISKQKTIENFKRYYKDEQFRGIYKGFEFTDCNKGYSLKQLIADLQKLNFDKFSETYAAICCFENGCMFVNGNLKDLDNDEVVKINNELQKKTEKAILGGRFVDPLIRGDAHLLEISRKRTNLDLLNFSFKKDVRMLDRLLFIEIESNKITYKDKLLHLDEFDASIAFFEDKLEKTKNYFRNKSTREEFIEAQDNLLKKYYFLLSEDATRFGIFCVESMLNGIDFNEYIEILETLDYEEYEKNIVKIWPIVNEAQIVMGR